MYRIPVSGTGMTERRGKPLAMTGMTAPSNAPAPKKQPASFPLDLAPESWYNGHIGNMGEGGLMKFKLLYTGEKS